MDNLIAATSFGFCFATISRKAIAMFQNMEWHIVV